MKVEQFLKEFVEMHGTRKWELSMYASNTGLIRNYINPIGELIRAAVLPKDRNGNT